jgi:hypothetical protein
MQRFGFAAALVASSIALGCPGTEDPPRPDASISCFVGDPSAPPEIEMIHLDSALEIVRTRADEAVPLIQPPQGGKVLFIAARARNIDGCPLTLSASLRDICTNQLLAVEERTVLMVPTEDGWLEPDQPMELSNYANLPVCPQIAATRDLEGELYDVRIRLRDRAGRIAEQTLRIKPECAEPDFLESCLCECDKDYVLGQACVPDTDTSTTACE